MPLARLLILILFPAVGLFLFIRGLRGRKIDDHPLCRKCGFDLIGLPEGSGRCSECGADLHAPHAIRHGHRKRRVGMLATGAVMLAVAWLVVGVGIYAAATDTNWQQYKPAWWLIREAASGDTKVSNDALVELSSRLGAGTLSQEQIDKLADRALARQADLSKPWTPAWGDMLESANAAGKLSNERWIQYLVHAPQLSLETRPDVRRGDPIPYWIRERNARVGSKQSLYTHHSQKDWTLGPLKKIETSGGGTALSVNGSGATGSSIQLKDDELARLPDGSNEVTMTLDLDLSKGWNTTPLTTTKVELKSSFNLVPASQPTAKLVTDPSFREAVEKSLSTREASYGQTWNPKNLQVTVYIDGNPVGIGYDVFTTINGKEVKLGTFSCPAKRTGHGWSMSADVPPFDDTKIDLVLKPNLKAALGTTDTFEVWDGEVTIKDVPVKHATTKPATTKPVTTKRAAGPVTTRAAG